MMLARSGDRGEPWASPLPSRPSRRDHDPGVEIAADELEHRRSPTVWPRGHQGIVLNPVEEPVEIDIDDPGLPVFDCLPGGLHRWWALRPGRKPKLRSENVGSKSGLRTWLNAC